MFIQRKAETKLKELTNSRKILILLGARQVGKTTLIKHFLKEKKAVFLNFDNESDRSHFISASALSPVMAIKTLGKPDFIVIDEAQRLVETGQVVKGWFDAEVTTKIILLGSSSLNLLNQSAESLTGRNEKIFLPPLTFSEIIATQSWFSEHFSEEQIQTSFSKQIASLLWQTMIFGCYPEAWLINDKQNFLLNLVSDYLLKDVLQLGLIKNPILIKKLLSLLAYQAGAEVSVSELSTALGMSRVTVEKYLDLLEQTFVIFRLPAFGKNPRREITKNQKIYFWDNGIRNAILNEFSTNNSRPDLGQLWENWVVSEVAKNNLLDGKRKNLYFWRPRGGSSEVDLIIKENEKISAFEIKWRKKNINKKAFEIQYQTKVKLIDSSNPLLVF
ncbi:MAG: ATP-binding protein [Candidatus Uhrbacteria bacterium]